MIHLWFAAIAATGVLAAAPMQAPICTVQFPNDGRIHPAVCGIGIPPQPIPHAKRHHHHSHHHRGHNMGRLVTR